jgi:hypothetical protein
VLTSHLLALLAIALMAAAWVAVQVAWRRTFPEACSDPDVLAGRMGCHGSNCSKDCNRPDRADPAEEEVR